MNDLWYYSNGEKPVGPVKKEELLKLLASGAVTPDTLVWSKSMENWLSASLVQELQVEIPQPPANGSLVPDDSDDAPPVELMSRQVSGEQQNTKSSETVCCSVCGTALQMSEVFQRKNGFICSSCINKEHAEKQRLGNFTRYSQVHATFLERAGAFLVDGLVCGSMQALIIPAFACVFGCLLPCCLVGLLSGSFGSLLFAYIYHAAFLSWYGATPGKLLAKIYVANEDGEPLSNTQIMVRPLAVMLSSSIMMIGHLVALCDQDNRALQDYICHTRVFAKSKK